MLTAEPGPPPVGGGSAVGPEPDGAPGDAAASGEPDARPPAADPDPDGPVSEADALRLLSGGAGDGPDRAEAARAAAIADLIAERLQGEASGLSIGTLTLFNDTVSFGGGMATGGATVAATRAGAAAGTAPGGGAVPVAAVVQAAHVDTYLQPDGYGAALDLLVERRVLVLACPPDTGRTAAALNLLAEALVTGGSAEGGCHTLTDPDAVLAPGWEPPVRGAGYLMPLGDGDGARNWQGIDAGWLTYTASRLAKADGFLVVLPGPATGATATAALRTGTVVQTLGAVDPVAVLERHALGSTPNAAELRSLRDRLTRSDALTALRERPEPRTAVRLAEVLRAGGDLAAEVARIRHPGELVDEWFARHDDPAAIGFALAAAVLEESTYLTVSDAAMTLYGLLSPDRAGPPPVRFRDRMALEQPWIDIARPADVGRPAGLPGPPVVVFRNPRVRQSVLDYAWTCLDGQRDTVLRWLRGLLNHPDLGVRARAAVAAGVMAWGDHRHALHRFLRSWAASTAWPLRQAAATALAVIAGRPELAADVWTLLNEWAADGATAAQRRLAGTAATAVGGILGRNEPNRATTLLRTALDRGDDWSNVTSVAWSALHLVEQGRAHEVLSALVEWSQPQDRSPMVAKALTVFLFAAGRPAPAPEGAAAAPAAPPLLLSDAAVRPLVTELWARALARRPVQDRALDALRDTVDSWAGHPGAQQALRSLLLGVAERPGKHRERLLHYLGRWAADRTAPVPFAAELARAVERGR